MTLTFTKDQLKNLQLCIESYIEEEYLDPFHEAVLMGIDDFVNENFDDSTEEWDEAFGVLDDMISINGYVIDGLD